jgi:hypothetical protein
MKQYDVIIVGAGPAGIFAALELARAKNGLHILMLDKGPELEKRRCVVREKGYSCGEHTPCLLLSGWGGAGAFSDGKLTLSGEVGGQLGEYVGENTLGEMIRHVDEVYLSFGAPQETYGADTEVVGALRRRAAKAGMSLLSPRIRHLGTDDCPMVLLSMEKELRGQGVEVMTDCEVEKILVSAGKVIGVQTKEGEKLAARYVVVAPGREGSAWLSEEAKRLGLKLEANPVDIGVRVETRASVLEELTEAMFEAKLVYYSRSFDDKVRTFCMCPYGEVTTENNSGTITVNGHSYSSRRTENTNFAILVSTSFTEPFKDPIAYGQYIARLANILGGGVIVQRLGDLQAGRRSTAERIERGMVRPTLPSATPGDLSFVLPHRYLMDILEMLEAMDDLAPGINDRHTLLYGVEAKFYSSRLQLSEGLETEVEGLFAAGDGAGVTRGVVQASASGVVAAREILKR